VRSALDLLTNSLRDRSDTLAGMEYSANEEASPDLAQLSGLAHQASKLLDDPEWNRVADERRTEGIDVDWLDEAQELRARLRELSFRLSDEASG